MRYRSQMLVFILGFLVLCFIGTRISNAKQDGGNGRYRVVEVTVNQYVWEVVSKANGKVLCEVIIEYDREPTPDETLAVCYQVYVPPIDSTAAANTTPQPTPIVQDRESFLNSIAYKLVDKRTFTRKITIPMQEMSLSIDVPEAKNGPGDQYVILSAYEPEPEYKITEIKGTLNGVPFTCSTSRCRLPIVQDSQVEFWATSSFGDESEHLTAILRISNQNGYPTVEITSLYPYTPFIDSCAQTWGSTDYVPPEWAKFPLSPADLNTGKSLFYLAAQLINAGFVDVSTCPSNGLLADGSPNGCGIERAKKAMIDWQNQYDVMIWSAGRNYGIPPILIKSILEVESQFWPANLRRFLDEYGLAQINQWGADVALRWDHELYKEICTNILSDCSLPYASLAPPLQAIMRGGLVRKINADCINCEGGIDYNRAVESIPAITRVIRSNCQQAKFIMDDRSANPSYEDMWKFTLVSYHSGYYCLDEGIRRTKVNQLAVTWENFAANVDTGCIGAVDYIDGLWKTLETFNSFRLTADEPASSIPPAVIVPLPTPTPLPTPVLAKSQMQVTVFVDANNNQVPDEGERVSGLQVIVTFADGSSVSHKTENGVAVFDLSGKLANSKATVNVPLIFRSQEVVIPESGVLPVLFKIQQADLPPVLP